MTPHETPHEKIPHETTPHAQTLHEKLAAARHQLVAAGISADEAAIDVGLYARTILDWDRARLLLEQRSPAPDALEPRFSAWVARRAHREPTAYIVGVREFWGLDFSVSPAVLIPRPCTELIVEEVARRLRRDGSQRVAEIGTGSGCIAVSIAREIPAARVTATDISADALDVARANAIRHGVADRVTFSQTSYLRGVEGTFDVIAANPPYVKEGDKPALARDVRHEPDVALFGGADGLRDVSGVLDTAAERLVPGGWLVMEFGYGQEDDVQRLVEARSPLRLDYVRRDVQGIARTAVIQRQPAA